MWPTGTVGENLYWLAEPVRYGWRSQPVRSRHAMRSANRTGSRANRTGSRANRTGSREPYWLAPPTVPLGAEPCGPAGPLGAAPVGSPTVPVGHIRTLAIHAPTLPSRIFVKLSGVCPDARKTLGALMSCLHGMYASGYTFIRSKRAAPALYWYVRQHEAE